MTTVRVTRTAHLPDDIRSARCRRSPDLGPALLFWSGGTALRDLSRTLKHYTHNSVHVITPFDSGGSSALLRTAFGMPSVGDLRNRLLALADDSLHGNPAVQELLSHRLPAQADLARRGLDDMIAGRHALVEPLPSPMRRIIRTHLRVFAERKPHGFDLRGASIGNLVLAGGWLHHEGDLQSVLYLFSKLVEARGLVIPVVEESLHLVSTLEDGRRLLGQHRLTGKEVAVIDSPVADLYLTRDLESPERTTVEASARVLEAVRGADLVCYPMGSFFSSLMATLLPRGVGRAIRQAGIPKVYVPNTGQDPEQLGLSVSASAARLLATLRLDSGSETPASDLLDFVVVDSLRGDYPYGLELEQLHELGVSVVDLPLVSATSPPDLDPDRLARVLLSLA